MLFNIFFFDLGRMLCRGGKGYRMGFLGGQELLIILIIVVLLFGAKKIPELAKGLGTGIKEFKKASNDAEKQINAKDDDSVSKKDEGKAA